MRPPTRLFRVFHASIQRKGIYHEQHPHTPSGHHDRPGAGQSTVGSYVGDSAITTKVKAKLLEDKTTGGMSIGVETLNGTVQLSGFAKSSQERAHAEALARDTTGVTQVRNSIVVRP